MCHIELQEEKIGNGEDEEEDEDEFAVDDNDKMYERQKVDGLHEYWLQVEPS